MGSIFGLFFIIIVLIIALVCVISNARKIKYYGGLGYDTRNFRQRFKIWMIVLLSPLICMGIVLVTSLIMRTIVIPIAGWDAEKPVYADSVETLYWPTYKMQVSSSVNSDWFEMGGETYSNISNRLEKEGINLASVDDVLGEPVAIIQYDMYAEQGAGFFILMNAVFAGLLDSNPPMPIYPIINDNGFDLYKINRPAENSIFCPYDQADSIVKFYTAYCLDYDNYNMQNLKCEYSAYIDEEAKTNMSGTTSYPYVHIKANIVFKSGVFETLKQLDDSDQERLRIEYHIDVNEEEIIPVPGTNIFSPDERRIRAFSNDGMSYIMLWLALYNDRVYLVDSISGSAITGLPVPDEYNQDLIDTVFVDLRDRATNPQKIWYWSR